MKRSNWILLLIICILAVVVYLNNREELKTESNTIKTSFIGLDTAKIDEIRMKTTEGEMLKLLKDNGEWVISEPIRYKANENFIASILKQIHGFTIESMISKGGSPDIYEKFEVDSLSGFNVEIYTTEKLAADFVIGKIADSYRHTYIKENGKDPVYLLKENLTYTFKKSLNDWRDKTILSFNKDLLDKIEYYRDELKDFTLFKEDTVWKLKNETDTYDGKMGSVNSLLANLINLKANGFYDEEGTDILKNPIFEIKIFDVSGKETLLSIYQSEEDENLVYLRKDEKGQIFTGNKSLIRNIDKTLDDLKENVEN